MIIHLAEQDLQTTITNVDLHSHVMIPSALLKQIVSQMTTDGCVEVTNVIIVLVKMIILILLMIATSDHAVRVVKTLTKKNRLQGAFLWEEYYAIESSNLSGQVNYRM